VIVRELLDYDEFCDRLADEFGLDRRRLVADAAVVADLGFDSLLIFEIVLLIEELAGATLPEALIGQLVTMNDFHAIYVTRATQTA
jgi:acyl carrier protein